jgi:hypothetical protein
MRIPFKIMRHTGRFVKSGAPPNHRSFMVHELNVGQERRHGRNFNSRSAIDRDPKRTVSLRMQTRLDQLLSMPSTRGFLTVPGRLTGDECVV